MEEAQILIKNKRGETLLYMTQIFDSSIKSEKLKTNHKEHYENLIGLIINNMNDISNIKRVYEYAQRLLYEEKQGPGS
jgi:hypothetical protein